MSEAIIVLGMHRSGTSAVSGTLMRLGGGSPKHLMPSSDGNERGYFESLAFMNFHDQLLESADSIWHDWREFNPEWRRSAVAADFRRRAKELLLEEFEGSALPVLKDPRICRFAPFWFDVLREMEIRPSIVIPVRSPLDVARSLAARHRLSLTHGLLLWLRHVVDAEAQSRDLARSIFTWQEFRDNWRGVCERIAKETHVVWPRMSDRASRGIERFLARDLVHHDTDHATLAAHGDVNEWTLRAYDALLELARNPHSNSALATLDEVRGLLDQSSKIFGRLLVDFEVELEEVRNRANSAERESEALRERDKEFDAARQAERLRDETRQEQASLASALSQAIAEREALQHENSTLVAELRSRRVELDEKSAALSELAERAEREREEAARDRESLARAIAERDALETAHASLAADLRSRQDELDEKTNALREALARADRVELERKQLREAISRLEAELQQRQEEANEKALALTELSARADAAEQARSEAERERETLARDISRSIAERDELRKAHSGLEAEVLSRRQELDRKTTALSELSMRAQQAELRRDDLARQNKALRRSLADAATEHSNARREMSEAARERADALSAQLELTSSELRAAREQARALAETQASRDAEASSARAKLVDAEAALASAEAKTARKGLRAWLAPAAPRRRLAKRLLSSGLFDVEFYSEQHSSANGDLGAAEHYVEEGYRSGYRPNPFFDTRWYLDRHEDVRRSGVNPLLHYILHGVEEGRDPGPSFQTNYYLEANPDVRDSGVNPLAHYLRHGRHEGRLPAPPA
jgi:hypothetical protein